MSISLLGVIGELDALSGNVNHSTEDSFVLLTASASPTLITLTLCVLSRVFCRSSRSFEQYLSMKDETMLSSSYLALSLGKMLEVSAVERNRFIRPIIFKPCPNKTYEAQEVRISVCCILNFRKAKVPISITRPYSRAQY